MYYDKKKTLRRCRDAYIPRRVTAEIKRQFSVSSPKELAEYVLYCFPPDTSGLRIAEALTNGWLSWYNDQRCTFVSTLMHEV